MYIHSYQIHNVLNVYRKQLSQGSLRNHSASPAKPSLGKDSIDLSIEGQRQSMFEKISAAIVERITQFGPETQAETPAAAIGGDAGAPSKVGSEPEKSMQDDAAFTYTTIDEHNQKRTNTLTVRSFGPPAAFAGSLADPGAVNVNFPEAE
jgi:hypothetical protein